MDSPSGDWKEPTFHSKRRRTWYIAGAIVALVVVVAVVVPTVIVKTRHHDDNVIVGAINRDPDCVLVSSGDNDGRGPNGTYPVYLDLVVNNLTIPWQLAFLPGGDILVTERPGTLRLVRSSKLVEKPVLQVPNVAGSNSNPNTSQGGLLGIVLHPDFATSRQFFIYATVVNQVAALLENQVQLWTLAEDHLSANFSKVILAGIPAADKNNGGTLKIRDNMLWVATGDAENINLNSQNDLSLGGKILRVNLDGSIPSDNPWPGAAGWVTGIKNPAGFDWLDMETIVLGDRGPTKEVGYNGFNGGDEIDVARKGNNLGWGLTLQCEAQDGYVSPRITWNSSFPQGGLVYYSGPNKVSDWAGSVLMTTLKGMHLQRVLFGQAPTYKVSLHEAYFVGQFTSGQNPPSIGRQRYIDISPAGDLYVTSSNCDQLGVCPPEKDGIYIIRPGTPTLGK